MDESINFFVGLDAHEDSISVAVCEAEREPSRFVGTLGPDVQGVLKTLRKYGPARHVIGKGNPGHVALYRYLAGIETVFILALRAQRESGFKH
ncbi:hypothetical protein J2W35_001696 [Variovorax boronicumulans]|nr:hypothetical protein [Variovorax boronicumulans]